MIFFAPVIKLHFTDRGRGRKADKDKGKREREWGKKHREKKEEGGEKVENRAFGEGVMGRTQIKGKEIGIKKKRMHGKEDARKRR